MPEQINIFCKICKKPLLVTDNSADPCDIGIMVGSLVRRHLEEEHIECAESVRKMIEDMLKKVNDLYKEYITPDLKEIDEMRKNEQGKT